MDEKVGQGHGEEQGGGFGGFGGFGGGGGNEVRQQKNKKLYLNSVII